MWRWLGVTLFVLATAGGAALGCGANGSSESDAKLRCDQEQQSKAQCVTDKAYAACLTCFEDCGDQCKAQATCPETYQCENQ